MAARAVCPCGWTGGPYTSPARAAAMAAKHVCKTDDGVRRATRRHRCARCGLEAVYENAGAKEARHWFSKHSCAKHEQAMLRATLHADKLAMIDRTPKPCHHKIANHQHGTNACYVLDKCRCEPCCKARHAQDDWRRRQQAYGRYHRYVDAAPAREHVQQLRDAGMGLKQIAKASGVAHGALWKLIYGKRRPDGSQTPSRRILRETAEKLYALDPNWAGPAPLADGALIDGHNTRLRLRSLVALGYSMRSLGNQLGFINIHTLVHGTMNGRPGDARVEVATAKAVEALFEQLCMTPPPETNQRERISASRARRYARERNWLPPLALDDLDTDHDDHSAPDYDEVSIQRRMHGDKTVPLTKAERIELARRWAASGRPLNEMQRITGINTHRYLDREQAS